jgi:hypothetical protein
MLTPLPERKSQLILRITDDAVNKGAQVINEKEVQQSYIFLRFYIQ